MESGCASKSHVSLEGMLSGTWSKAHPPAQRKWMKCPSAASKAVLPMPLTPLRETKRLDIAHALKRIKLTISLSKLELG